MSARRSVIVVTYGRTGSTLLVGLLNTAPEALVRGENGNFFFHLYKAYDALLSNQKRGGGQPNHPFFGAKDADIAGFLAQCRQAVYTVLAPKAKWGRSDPTTIGFKEVRYLTMSYSDLSNYIDFLAEVFPDPLFVFLTRDHEQVMSSGFYARRQKKGLLAKQLKKCDRRFSRVAQGRSDCFHIDYTDLNDGQRLRALFAAAGLTYDPTRIRSTLEIDHSPQTPDHLRKRNARAASD